MIPMLWKRIWNAVMAGVFHAHRYCPMCGRIMQRVPAIEERYVRRSRSYPMGSRDMGRFGGRVPAPGLRTVEKVEVTPVYDVCEACGVRIRQGTLTTKLT